MKNSIKKLFIFLLVLSAIITSNAPSLTVNAANMPYVIHETKDSNYLASGVLYENVRKFTSKGWWNINVVRVDLTNEYAEIGGLFGQNGLSNRETVSKMVTDSKAVAGVNGDFFNYSPIAHPMGTFIDDGEVISSPIERAYALPTFYLDIANNPDISFFDRRMNITSLNSGQSVNISLINKAADMNMVTLLNKHWGFRSFGNKYNKSKDDQMVEMVVVDNIVKDIRIGKEAVSIPENGYVIAVRGDRKKPLLEHFNIGDEVKLNIGTTPNLENIKFAIGGGSIILKDGKITNSNINVKGDHPRTGIGITKDKKELIIATIDGRDISFKGVSQDVFGAILRDLGAHDAINLDGGGSTTMAIKPVDEQVVKVVNKVSDGGERKVVNGVGVFSNAPKGELSYIKVSTDDTNMFLNTSRKFTIKGYDEHHNPVEVDQSKATYTFEGIEGEINGNILKAKSSGLVKVQANYEGLTSTIDLKVLGEVKNIILPLSEFNLHTNSQRNIGTIYGKDNNGYKARIYHMDIDWALSNDIGYVKDGIFYSKDILGAGAITLRVGDAVNNILVSIGSGDGVLIEGFENLENFKTTTYPEYVKGSISLNPTAKEGKSSISLKYDFTKGDVSRASYLLFKPGGKNGLALDKKPTKLSLWVKGDDQGSWLRGTIRDKNGKTHTLDFAKALNSTDWQYVEANIPSNVVYPITLDRIYVVETDNSKKYSGEILIDSLMASYPLSYDNIKVPNTTGFKDDKNVKMDKAEGGFSLIITRAPSKLNEITKNNANSKIQNKANTHDLSLFIGGTTEEFRKEIKSEKIVNINTPYKTHRYKNLMFIDASSAKGGIRATNPQQWIWLKNGLANAEEDHIILFLNTPISGYGGFKDPLEVELLHSTLVETAERGKTVWVISKGNSTKTDLRDGIRYIEFNNKNIIKPEDVKNINGIEFIINGKDITYQISPIF